MGAAPHWYMFIPNNSGISREDGYLGINKQFSEGQLSVFLLLSHVFGCCVVLLAVGKSNPRIQCGCDYTELALRWITFSFNPRTREGCDATPIEVDLPEPLFQSTHP